jgi:predicted transcriptional regulator
MPALRQFMRRGRSEAGILAREVRPMKARRTARDYMSRELIVLAPEMDLGEAIRLLVTKDFSSAPVVDARGDMVGLLTDKDCFRAAYDSSYHQELSGPVSGLMSTDIDVLHADMDMVEVLGLFFRGPRRRFPVLEQGRLVGMLCRRDVLRALHELW